MTDTLDITAIRQRFPILHQKVNGYPLVYFDNAATTQKPQSVIDCIADYYNLYNANIHRGAHYLANISTEKFEGVREQVCNFIGAKTKEEIIFTSGTTDAINLVAQTWGRKNISAGDEIVVSMMEHHSNIVPWQMLAMEKGATLKVIPITDRGELNIGEFEKLLNSRTKLVAVNHVSNALGTINPIEYIIRKSKEFGAKVLIDGAQAVSHFAVNVVQLDCDFYCFSGHKLYGPTGVGVLYGKLSLLNEMPPWRGGGEMIRSVSFEKTTYNDPPFKFEAGTPNIEAVIALGKAITFIEDIGWDALHVQESALLATTTEALQKISSLQIFGTADQKTGVVSFLVDGVHPYDLGTLLDQQGIAVRTGHHCTEPLWNHYGVTGTVRASFALYNTEEEIAMFLKALQKSIQLLQ
jgi:cysteine desulfurase / selenocysteine lyase